MRPKRTANRIAIEGDFNIFTACAQHERLLDACGGDGDVEVDLSRVTEIDSAGVQLMLAARREAVVRDKRLRFTGDSPVVAETVELLGLSDRLDWPSRRTD